MWRDSLSLLEARIYKTSLVVGQSQVAGKIKKIKKMKGDKLKNAEKALKKAIDAMANLKKVIG